MACGIESAIGVGTFAAPENSRAVSGDGVSRSKLASYGPECARAPDASSMRTPALIVCTVTVLLAGCDIFSRWDAIVYPNRFDKANSIGIGTYGTLEQCRAASLAKLAEMKAHEDIGGYICGQNCLVKTGFGNTRMCARTAR